MDLDRRAARRGLNIPLAIGLSTLLAQGCVSSESATPVPTTGVAPSSEKTAEIGLTTEQRKAIIKRVEDLQIALFGTFANGLVPNLAYLGQMNDRDLMAFWNDRVVRQENGFVEWRLKIRKNNEGGTPTSPTRVFVTYNPEYPNSILAVIMRSNFIEASHVYPHLQQFIDPATNQIPIENLQEAMGAYLNIPVPEETKYYPIRESRDNNSKQIGLYGKFGSSRFGTQTINATLYTNGDTAIAVTRGQFDNVLDFTTPL